MSDPSDARSGLIEQAMAIKSEQLAQDRRNFDKWPRWKRNSLFSDPVSEAFHSHLVTCRHYLYVALYFTFYIIHFIHILL